MEVIKVDNYEQNVCLSFLLELFIFIFFSPLLYAAELKYFVDFNVHVSAT